MAEPLLAGSPAPGSVAGAPPAGAGYDGGAMVASQGRDTPVWAWLRFFGSELRLVFGRRRNQALLAVVALFPLVIGIGLRLADQGGNSGGPSVAFIGQLAGNGVFLSFIALSLLLILVMPLAVAVVSGDSMAGEAGYGTLRSLLAVPAGRVRLLSVKYAAIVVFAVTVTFMVTAAALATGAALFPIGPVTLLSGTTVPIADAMLRLLFVMMYVSAAMASLGMVGMAISTLTEHAVGAIGATAIVVVTSEVVDNVPQFAAIHPYLPTHWWISFDSLLRVPIDTGTLMRGLLSFGMYLVIFGAFTWARFTTADVTS